MSMLKTIVLSQIFVINKMLGANEAGSINDNNDDKLIKQFIEPKTRNLSKSQKLFKS